MATKHRYQYETFYLNILSTVLYAILFAAMAYFGKFLVLIMSTSYVILVIIYLLLYSIILGSAVAIICYNNHKSMYYRMYNKEIMKYITIQNTMYETIQQECDELSKAISTSSVIITFRLGCSHVKKCQHYCDIDTQEMIRTTNFDHIIMKRTTRQIPL